MSDPGTYLPTYLPTQVGTYQRVNVIFTFFSFTLSRSFSFTVDFLAFRPALGMELNRRRKKRCEIEAEQEIKHELPYTEIVNLGLLDSPQKRSCFF